MAKIIQPTQKQPKRVLIGTPALDGRVDAWYTFALHEITKLCVLNNIDLNVSMLSYESILPMARNELLTFAIQQDFDCLVFIDSDVYCNPQSFFEIVKDSRDVAAIPTVKKSDQESYDIGLAEEPQQTSNWIKTNYVSTSCLKISKKALRSLAENSTVTEFRGKQLNNICQYDFVNAAFIGEDIYLCQKLKQLGFDIWLNMSSTCMHVGPKIYKGDFKVALQNAIKSSQ